MVDSPVYVTFGPDEILRIDLLAILEHTDALAKIAIDPRTLAENALWAAVINYFRGLYNRFIREAKNSPILSPAFWDNEKDALTAIVLPHLTNISQWGVFNAEKKLNTLQIAFDNTLVHVLLACRGSGSRV